MSSFGPARQARPPAWFFLLAAGAFGLGLWLLLQAFTSPAVRECRALYHGARTAADTTRIDSLVPADGADPHSCGFIRRSARWSTARRS